MGHTHAGAWLCTPLSKYMQNYVTITSITFVLK